ncbi:MAG TPA: hypothetical protein PLF61_02940 [Candidatus Goldiibacteriota bacterium]|nr:hypothetical protein [Candidatus Goldiibacteriota bacterium]
MNRANKALISILFLLVMITILFTVKIIPLNPDTYWHLSSGREIIKNGGIPQTDNFSFIGPNKWYAHEWLFGVILYLVSKITGPDNLFFLNFFIWIVIFAELLLIIRKKTNLSVLPVYLPFFLVLIYLLQQFIVLRPQIFTYIFVLYFIYVLENEPVKENAALYFSLPFVTILWVNFHAATFLGILLVLWYLSYYVIKKRMYGMKTPEYGLEMMAFVLAGVILASFCSPSGLKGLFFLSKDNFVFVKKNIQEWQYSFPVGSVIDITFFVFFYFYATMFFILLLYNLKTKDRKKKTELINNLMLALIFFVPSILAIRNIPLFLLVSFPVFIYYVNDAFQNQIVNDKKPDKIGIQKFFAVITATLIMLVLAYSIVVYNSPKKRFYPEDAIRYVKENNPRPNIFSDMLWAGFLEYYLYPDYKVMLTGRFNYDTNLLSDYSDINNGINGFLDKIKKYNLKTFLLGYRSPIISKLTDLNYGVTYFDDVVLVLEEKHNGVNYFKYVRPYDENNFYDKNNYEKSLHELNDFMNKYPSEKVMFMYALILLDGEKEKAVKFLENGVKTHEKYYSLYNLLGAVYFENKDYKRALKMLKLSKKKNNYINRMIKELKKIIKEG